MKLKKFLAGVLAAAMVVTGLPVAGLENTAVRAAEEEETEYVDVPIKMGAADSQELIGESNDKNVNGWAKHAVDGDINTYWHSQWKNVDGGSNVNMANGENNSYYIALEKASSVDKVTYLPRQNAQTEVNGTILKCEVSVTTDALAEMPSLAEITTAENAGTKNSEALGVFTAEDVTWKPVTITTFDAGNWEFDDAGKEILFGATEENVTGIKITVTAAGGTSENNTNKFISCAEFGVKAEKPEAPREPVYEEVNIKMGAADSQEMTGEGDKNGWAKCAVDGDEGTFWHSAYNSDPKPSFSAGTNTSYYIALEEASSVDKLTYLPRQRVGGGANGTLMECEISVTTDALNAMPSVGDITDQASAAAKNNEAVGIFTAEGITWKPVAITTFDAGNWPNDNDLKEILFPATQEGVTGIKITAIHAGSVDNRPDQFISAAEFDVWAEVPPTYKDVEIQMGAAESQELTGELTNGSNYGWAAAAVDGNEASYWHSKWSGGSDVTMANDTNNSFFIALKEASSVDKITYLPRKSSVNGRILKCEIYVTKDELAGMPSLSDISNQATAASANSTALGIFKAEGINWNKVGDADWESTDQKQEFVFPVTKKNVTGIKITVKEADSDSGGQFISGAEFGVQVIDDSEPDPIIPEPTYVKADIKMGAAGSQEMTGELTNNKSGWAKCAVDGDEDTYWHSKYSGGNNVNIANDENNSFYIALKKASSVDKIAYVPRRANADVNGTILNCEVYVTTDRLSGMPSLSDITDANSCTQANDDAMSVFTSENVTWKKVDIKTFDEGNWAYDAEEKAILFDTTEEKVTGIQIKALATGSAYESNYNKFINAAEFTVFGKEVPPEPEFVNEKIKMGAAESQEMSGESNGANGWAKYAVDGKEATYWHSNYNPNDVNIAGGENSSYYIALDKATSVDKLTYLPRQTQGVHVNGTILNCDVYVTTDELAGMPSVGDISDRTSASEKNAEALAIFKADNVNWKKVETAAFDAGNWAYDQNAKEIVFKKKERNVTGIKITAKATGAQSDSQNDMFISGAEFGVIRRTVEDETVEDAIFDLVDIITPSMNRVIASGNMSGGEQVYSTASYRKFKAAYEEAQRLAELTDLTGVTIEEVKAAKGALQDLYGRLLLASEVKLITGTPDITVTAPEVGAAPKDAELTGGILDTNAYVDVERLEFDEEGGISGKITAPNEANSTFNIKGDTKFLIHFEMKTEQVSGTKAIIGKMDQQYGLQIESNRIFLFGKTEGTETLTGDWLEVDCAIPSEEGWYDKWHDVVAIFNGSNFELYLDGEQGYIPDGYKGRSGLLMESSDSVFGIFYNPTKPGQEFGGKLRDISMYIGDQVPEYTIEEDAAAEDVVNMFKTALEGREKSFELNAKAASQQMGYTIRSTTWEPAADTFARYQDYAMKVVVQADEGYEFAEGATAVVRTGAADSNILRDAKVVADGDEMVITYTFKGETHPREVLADYIRNDEALKSIGWRNRDANGVRKYTAASWSAYLNAFNAASVANGSALSAEEYIEVIDNLKSAIAGLKPAAENCECDLVEITDFADASITMGMSAEKTVTLGGDCKYTNECLVHPSAKLTKSYTITSNTAGATLNGNELKVTQAGTVQVRLTVGLGTKTKTASATFTITSRRPTDEQKNALANAIANVENNYAPNSSRYTAMSWRAVTDALEAAKKFGATATADKITDYEKAITDALANLVIRDKKSLEDLMAEIAEMKADDYTADSWNRVKAAYDSAAALIGSETAAMDDYAKAYNELTAAKAALMTKAEELASANKELSAALAAAASVYTAGQQNYTDETWKAFADAYTAANAVTANADAASIQALAASLKNAQAALAVVPLQTGATAKVGKFQYKVVSAEEKTAMLVKGTDNKQKTVKIPDTVKINGVSCKVVKVGSKAFSGYKSMTKVTIGKNVTAIEKAAFKNCSKLKNVIVNGTALNSIKKNAFAKTASKITVKASKFTKAKKNELLKKMKNAGMSKKAVIK